METVTYQTNEIKNVVAHKLWDAIDAIKKRNEERIQKTLSRQFIDF